MKTLTFSWLFLLFLSTSGCKPEPVEVLNLPCIKVNGTAKCNLEDAIWNGLASPIEASSAANADHYIDIFKSTAGVKFQFSGFKLEKGRYPIFPEDANTSESVITTSYQFVGNTYDLIELESIENYFEITSINWSRNEIEGKFQAVYEGVDPFSGTPGLSTILINDSTILDSLLLIFEVELPLDTVIVRNGSFKTFLKE